MPAQITIALDPETSQDAINALKQQIAEQNIKGLSARTTGNAPSATSLATPIIGYHQHLQDKKLIFSHLNLSFEHTTKNITTTGPQHY